MSAKAPTLLAKQAKKLRDWRAKNRPRAREISRQHMQRKRKK